MHDDTCTACDDTKTRATSKPNSACLLREGAQREHHDNGQRDVTCLVEHCDSPSSGYCAGCSCEIAPKCWRGGSQNPCRRLLFLLCVGTASIFTVKVVCSCCMRGNCCSLDVLHSLSVGSFLVATVLSTDGEGPRIAVGATGSGT
jgi:hypothetical protein